MKNILKFLNSNTLLISINTFLLAILIFWALTIDNCLKVNSNQINIEVACQKK